jgi:hypothetical protein
MSEAKLALLFRVGGTLVGVDALGVQSALLRSDPLVAEVARGHEARWQGTSLKIHNACSLLDGSESPWESALILKSGERLFAIGVGKCEVVREVRVYGRIARTLFRNATSLEMSVLGVRLSGNVESLGVYLALTGLSNAVGARA